MEIVISMDSVTIWGQTIMRPDSISRMQWLEYWEGATNPPPAEIEVTCPDCSLIFTVEP